MADKRTKRKRKRGKGPAKSRPSTRSRRDSGGQAKKPSKSGSELTRRERIDRFFEPSAAQVSGDAITGDTPPLDYDEEDIEEYADLWGVSYEEAEAVLEESTDVFANVPLDDYGRPDIDYMSELADLFDVEVSDLYDLYYGCTPGSSE